LSVCYTLNNKKSVISSQIYPNTFLIITMNNIETRRNFLREQPKNSENYEADFSAEKFADNEKNLFEKILEAIPDLPKPIQRRAKQLMVLFLMATAAGGFAQEKKEPTLPGGFQEVYSDILTEKISGEVSVLDKKLEGEIPGERKIFLIEKEIIIQSTEEGAGYTSNTERKIIISVVGENQKIEKVGQSLNMEGVGTNKEEAIRHALGNAVDFLGVQVEGIQQEEQTEKTSPAGEFSQEIKNKSEAIFSGYEITGVNQEEGGGVTVTLKIYPGVIKT
jgi:hypothetical protein